MVAAMKPLRAALSIVAVCLMVSCGTKPHVTPAVVTAPPRALPVSTAAEAVRHDAVATSQVSQRLESQVAGLRQSTATLRERVTAAVDETAKLKAAKGATEAQIARLCDLLTETNQKAVELSAEVEATQKSADEQRTLRFRAEDNLAALMRSAAAKDAECDTLRSQNSDLAKTLDALTKDRDQTSALLAKAEKQAAVGRYLRNWLIGIVIGVVAYFILRIYLPRIPRIPI